MAQWRKVVVSGSTAELNNISASGDIVPITTDGSSLGSSTHNFSDLFLDSGAVVNFDSGDMTLTHAANEVQVDGGDLVVESTNKVGFGGAPSTDYIHKSTDVKIVAAADITLNPGGNNVKPGGNSEDDLGVSGTAWRTLYVDSIKMNGQGSIDGATHITGSGNLEISGNISGSINTTGSFSDLMAVGAGASVAASSASLVSFRNNANSQFGYLASADTQAITTGIVGYNTSTGNLTISSVIDGGSF